VSEVVSETVQVRVSELRATPATPVSPKHRPRLRPSLYYRPPPPPRAPQPRGRAEGGARGPAGLGISETSIPEKEVPQAHALRGGFQAQEEMHEMLRRHEGAELDDDHVLDVWRLPLPQARAELLHPVAHAW